MVTPDKVFSAYVPITKAYDSPDGDEWIFEGPLSEPSPDVEGDRVNQEHLFQKGMELFDRFGGPVDWDHMYPKTKDPKWIIGKGQPDRFMAPHPDSGAEVPWMRTKLFKKNAIAKSVKDLYDAGGSIGYSIYGTVDRVLEDGSLASAVMMTSMTPTPVVSANAGTMRLAKALSGAGDELPVVPETREDVLSALLGHKAWEVLERLAKALEATGALPKAGPGVDAAGVEDLGAQKKRRKISARKLLAAAYAKRLRMATTPAP